MKRRRVSSEGQLLLKLAYTNEEILIKKEKPSKFKIKKMLCGLFHTDYDNKLENGTTQLYSSGRKLFTFVKHDIEEIPQLMNNAITNIILLILTNEGRIATKFEARRNYLFYMDLAEKAFKIKDHNTCIMIISAVNNAAIEKLKFKKRKKDKQLLINFKERYGEFKSNCIKHIRDFTQGEFDKSIEIPSLMMFLINIKRLSEIEKVIKTQGGKTIIKLQDLLDFYYDLFEYEEAMDFILLYTKNPLENKVMKQLKGKDKSEKFNLYIKIFEISNCIIHNKKLIA
jgi:hypothetical protein